MQVIFTQRCGKYFPGANPLLEPAVALVLIGRGVCRPVCAAPPAPEPPVEEPTDVKPEAPTLPVEEPKPTAALRRRHR